MYVKKVLVKPQREKKKEETGDWWGRIECQEMGMTHSFMITDQDTYRKLPRLGVEMVMTCGLKPRQSSRETEKGTFVNQSYDLELISLEPVNETAGSAAGARR